MKKDNKKLKMKRGFTLMETLIAISILLVAVVGPMSTIGGSLSSIFFARDQMIAINFAQEGVEVVRQKRDSNMLNKWNWNGSNPIIEPSWSDNLSAGDYVVSAPTLGLISSAPQPIYQKDDTGLYYQSSSVLGAGYTKTQYNRAVNIADIPSSAEKTVTSTVSWSVGGVMKKVEVKESIFGINS